MSSIALPLLERIALAKVSLGTALPGNMAGPSVGLILGSGLGAVTDAVQIERSVPYDQIDGLVSSTAPGHKGSFGFGSWQGVTMMVCQGRVHLYEGYTAQDVAMPVYLMAAMGVETLIITNAAGGLNPTYDPGSVVMISDHINMTGYNPLVGIDTPEIGVRFPDMSRAYDPDIRAMVHRKTLADIAEGVYVGVSGPSLETSAERRFYAQCGGDMIGMSTVIEVIAAAHCGINVLGFSVVTNKATGGVDQQADTLEEVLANAETGGRYLKDVLYTILPELTND